MIQQAMMTTIKPNFSPEGRSHRLRIGIGGWVTAAIFAAACIWLRAPWYIRLATGLPLAIGTASFLQTTRKTCVTHARHGTFERSDMSVVPANPADAAVSRRIGGTIIRDGIIAGLIGAALAAASAWL
jgi:hypothetical protein